jgi:hypothetical protein
MQGRRTAGLSYMTAEQMAEKIVFLTGFYQPGFEEFASIIGRYDPATGVRTTDRPTIMSTMVIQGLTREVGASVVEREIFLGESDRVVFRGINLEESPPDERLAHISADICTLWLTFDCPPEIQSRLAADFRATELQPGGLMNAWKQLVSSLLQIGTLYYF